MPTRRAGDFYSSREWGAARYAALVKSDGRCSCCGAGKIDGARLHVDHIKPRSKFPELALDPENLQVLCDLCNVAKSNIDMTRWEKVDQSRGVDYREFREGEARIFRLLREIK